MVWWWIYLVAAVLATVGREGFVKGEDSVTYDGRSLIINGQRKILFSGSIHYPRSTPQVEGKELVIMTPPDRDKEIHVIKTMNNVRSIGIVSLNDKSKQHISRFCLLMWPSLIAKAKEGGVDVIQTYVFWNLHEPQPGQYDFSGRYDLVKFMKEIQAQGLYACLRIGPYIESEWTYGGFPFWLHDVPGIVYRTDNEPFKYYMQNFTTKIVNLMKSEGLYASQGGPIILSQIENEYQNIEAAFHEKGAAYVRWAAKMAVELETGVPWVMCKQTDAPDPVINTCNGMRCGETFGGPNSPNKPSIWTENWTSFYQVYGGKPYIRSAQVIAFHVTLFIAKRGSYVNYYMYHGGTNFGRMAAAYVITSYYDQAPLDEYSLPRQPKWGHLKELHIVIKNCSTSLLQGVQSNFSLGQFQQAYVFEEGMGGCIAFLVNNDSTNNATVQFRNNMFELLPKSISILPDCQNMVFNTAKVNTESNKRITTSSEMFNVVDSWKEFRDSIPNFLNTSLQSNSLLEHMNTTKDKSDYLWYTFSFQSNSSCIEPMLHIESLGHVVHSYINNKFIEVGHGSHDTKGFSMEIPISLTDGMNNISILSVMVGLPDSGAFLESRFAGLSKVNIQCSESELYDFTNYTWGYQIGLVGEKFQVYKEQNLEDVEWSEIEPSTNKSLTWYKTVFDAPIGDDPVALNLSSMQKGEVWVNEQSIGRYWVSFHNSKGIPSQTLYHVPRSFLKPFGNLLVVLEELNGDPLHISLETISVANVESPISYNYLPR